MPDAQRVIEEIKHLLYSAGNPLPDEVLSIAGDYQDLCIAVNDRLRACAGLLRRGLRSEAIQQADEEPILLDLVATLDFAERSQWCDYLRQMGEMVPPDLLMDAASELNDAYAIEQPLLKLLRRHRKRALARAPLAQRIEVLRAIADADPLNNVWQEDLQTFEFARHRQIESEVNIAAKSSDLPALATLETEVLAADWRNPPSDALRATIKRSHARLQQQRAREELAVLEPELTAAHATFDAESARRLRARWQACAKMAGLSPNELLSELAAPALAWLDEEDRREEARAEFDTAVYELEQKLDSGASRDELAQAFHKAFQYEIELPAVLGRRLRERFAAIDAGTRRRFHLITAGIVCALLTFGAVTIMAVRHKLFVNDVAEAVGHVKAMLDDGKLPEAHEYLVAISQQRPDIAQSGPMREQRVRYDGMKADDDQRQAQFDEQLQTAELLANFDQATLKSLDKAEAQLKDHVAPLVRHPDQRTRVDALTRRLVAKRLEVKTEIDDDFTDRLNELIARCDELEQGKVAPAESLEVGLADLRRQLNSMGDHVEAVSSRLMEDRATVINRVDALEKIAAARRARKQWQMNVTQAIGESTRFAAMLRAYEAKFPDSPRAHDFGTSAAEMPLWSVLPSWDAGIGRLHARLPQDWVTEAQKMLNDPLVSKLPMITILQETLPYFEAAAKRPAGPLPEALAAFFDNPLISGLSTIDVQKDGAVRRYYVRSEPKYQVDGRFTFRYVKNFQLEEQLFEIRKGYHLISKDDIVLHDGNVMQKAPQWNLADAIRKCFGPRPWEANLFDALEKVSQDTAVDPLVKVLFIKSLVDAGKQGSLAFEEATRPLTATLNDVNADANWLLPDEAAAERSTAAASLQRLPSFAEMRKVADQRLIAMQQLPAGNHRWVGWLARVEPEDVASSAMASNNVESGDKAAAGPNWSCLTKEPIVASGKLIVLLQPKADGPIQLAVIGQAKNGKPAVTLNSGDALVEGRPVFLTED